MGRIAFEKVLLRQVQTKTGDWGCTIFTIEVFTQNMQLQIKKKQYLKIFPEQIEMWKYPCWIANGRRKFLQRYVGHVMNNSNSTVEPC